MPFVPVAGRCPSSYFLLRKPRFLLFCVIFAPHFGHAGKENTQTGYKEEKDMQQLKERILRDGKCFEGGILKVDNFINHQMDPILMKSMAVEFVRRFASRDINKILTIEASGIAPAIMVGYLLELPVVFAKKKKPSTMENMLVTKVFSFTKTIRTMYACARIICSRATRCFS